MSSYSEFRAQTKKRRRRRNVRRIALLIITAVVICGLAWVITFMIDKMNKKDTASQENESSSASQSANEDNTAQQPPAQQENESSQAKPAGWNVVGPMPSTIDQTVVNPDYRMISLPANGRVETSYFANTLFIGDSVSQGWVVYDNPIKDISTFCAYKSSGPDSVVNNSQFPLPDGTRVPIQDNIAQQLAAKQPEHIYILFGANSLKSLTTENFIVYYGKMLDWLKTVCRPDAQIYIQSITPVTAAYEASDARYSQSNLYAVNNALAQMAYERGMYFVDLTEVLAGDDGYLRPEYAAADGIHLQGAGYRAWLDYLAEHTAYSPTAPYIEGSPYYKAPQTA